MTPYEQVKDFCWNTYGWPTDSAPAPEATTRQVELDEPKDIAATLEGWVRNVMATSQPPYGIETEDDYHAWVCHRTFAIGREYWEYNTGLALGQYVEPPVDLVAAAQSVSEWYANQSNWRTRLGTISLDRTPEGEAEMQRRLAKSKDVPLEWVWAGKQNIWELAVVEGYIKTTVDTLSAAYAVNEPSLDSVRFLDAQQWLDNLRCRDAGRPSKWLDDGTPNPAFAGF